MVTFSWLRKRSWNFSTLHTCVHRHRENFVSKGQNLEILFPFFSREADGVLITKEKKLVCSIGARAQALMWSQKWGVKEIQGGEAHQRLLNCCQFWLKGIQHEEEWVKRSHSCTKGGFRKHISVFVCGGKRLYDRNEDKKLEWICIRSSKTVYWRTTRQLESW